MLWRIPTNVSGKTAQGIHLHKLRFTRLKGLVLWRWSLYQEQSTVTMRLEVVIKSIQIPSFTHQTTPKGSRSDLIRPSRHIAFVEFHSHLGQLTALTLASVSGQPGEVTVDPWLPPCHPLSDSKTPHLWPGRPLWKATQAQLPGKPTRKARRLSSACGEEFQTWPPWPHGRSETTRNAVTTTIRRQALVRVLWISLFLNILISSVRLLLFYIANRGPIAPVHPVTLSFQCKALLFSAWVEPQT